MRTVIALLAFTLAAKGYAAPGGTLEAEWIGHYTTQKTRLVQEGKRWFCETELRPRLELKEKPEAWKLFPVSRAPASRPDDSSCRDKLYLSRSENGKTRLWSGCAGSAEARPFLQALARSCLR